jgi:hypothetical protein
MDNERLKNELVIQNPLDPWITLSEVSSRPFLAHPMFLAVEIPGQFIPLSPVPWYFVSSSLLCSILLWPTGRKRKRDDPG